MNQLELPITSPLFDHRFVVLCKNESFGFDVKIFTTRPDAPNCGNLRAFNHSSLDLAMDTFGQAIEWLTKGRYNSIFGR